MAPPTMARAPVTSIAGANVITPDDWANSFASLYPSTSSRLKIEPFLKFVGVGVALLGGGVYPEIEAGVVAVVVSGLSLIHI